MRILFVPLSENSMAHVVRTLALAEEARKRGHNIMFTSTRSKTKFIQSYGFEVFRDGFLDFKNYEGDRESYYKDLRGYEIEAARKFQTDVVVNDPVIAGNFISYALDLPLVTVTNSVLLPDYSGTYGYSFTKKKKHNFYGYEYPEKIMFNKIIKTFRDLDLHRIPSSYKDLYRNQLIIIPSIPILDPIKSEKRRISSNIHYVGPIFLKDFENIQLNDIDLSKEWLFINFGGSVLQKDTYITVVNALLKLKFNLFLAVGPEFDKNFLKTDNPRILVKKYLPGLECSKLSRLCINSGSHGTISQALYFSKPSICIPHNVDQATFAQRITEIGCGIDLVNHKTLTKDFDIWTQKARCINERDILNSINFVLQNFSKYEKSCKKVCSEIHNYKEPVSKSLDLIEQFITKPKFS